MLERPLVALDGSNAAESALPCASLLARTTAQPVDLLLVVPPAPTLRPAASDFATELALIHEQRMKYAGTYLDGIRVRLERDGVWADPLVTEGSVDTSILATAAQQQSGLIVMSTHGYSGVTRLLLGSVADRVVRTAPIPVLLPRHPGNHDQGGATITQIVLPLDGSERAEAAIPYATFLAQQFSVPILVLRTLDTDWMVGPGVGLGAGSNGEVVALLEQDIRTYVESCVTTITSSGVLAESHLSAFTSPATEIERIAEENPHALVVMATHGRSGLRRALIGSVTDRVIRSGVASVLVVPTLADG